MCDKCVNSSENQDAELKGVDAAFDAAAKDESQELNPEQIANGLGMVLAAIAHGADDSEPSPGAISIESHLEINAGDVEELADAVKIARKASAVAHHIDFHTLLVEQVGELFTSRNMLRRSAITDEERETFRACELVEIDQIIATAMALREELRARDGKRGTSQESADELLESLGSKLTEYYSDGVSDRVNTTLRSIASSTKYAGDEAA